MDNNYFTLIDAMKVKPDDIVNGTNIAEQLVVSLLGSGVDIFYNGDDPITYAIKNGYSDIARLIVDEYARRPDPKSDE